MEPEDSGPSSVNVESSRPIWDAQDGPELAPCPCGSVHFLSRPSGDIVCSTCSRPALFVNPRQDRP
jgi:hypothetical protein